MIADLYHASSSMLSNLVGLSGIHRAPGGTLVVLGTAACREDPGDTGDHRPLPRHVCSVYVAVVLGAQALIATIDTLDAVPRPVDAARPCTCANAFLFCRRP